MPNLQKRIIIAACILALGLCLFPPIKVEGSIIVDGKDGGRYVRHDIYTGPYRKGHELIFGLSSREFVDLSRLVPYLAIILSSTVFFVTVLLTTRSNDD
jgi:hypothetical protein